MNGTPETKCRAIVFVTDEGFLTPSLVAAAQIALQPKILEIADIYIITVDFDKETIDNLKRISPSPEIKFLNLKSEEFQLPEGTFFNKTHVAKTTLGRFALHKVLPPHYEHVLYLDGDILIVGDIAPLVRHDVRPGWILASNDYLWLCENDRGQFWTKHRAYLDGLGIHDPIGYFNAGVLAFRLDTWRVMAPKALEYFVANSEVAIYHDQSALNAVFHGRREVLSPRYNFTTNFAEYGLENEVDPAIIHFTGAGKPWFFDGPPWNGRFASIYAAFFERNPELKSFIRRPDASAVASTDRSYRSRQRKLRLLTPWRQPTRRRRFRRFLRETAFGLK